jgi:signal transduction histidine kinase
VTRISTGGELTAAVAHELNQPLGAILSNAEAAEMYLKAEPPALGRVTRAEKSISASFALPLLRVFCFGVAGAAGKTDKGRRVISDQLSVRRKKVSVFRFQLGLRNPTPETSRCFQSDDWKIGIKKYWNKLEY